jgi:hypothetical protein
VGVHDSEFLCRAARSASRYLAVRGLRYHVNLWGDPATITQRPLLVWMHGWMDCRRIAAIRGRCDGDERVIAAPDWRLRPHRGADGDRQLLVRRLSR